MKSNPTSVPIYRPQSDSSKRQQPQKKLTPIKIAVASKAPNQKKIRDQDKNQLSEAEDNKPKRKIDEPISKVKPRETTESSASKKKVDVDIKIKQTKIKPKKDAAPYSKITTEHKCETKTSEKKEIPLRKNINADSNLDEKAKKMKFGIKVNPKAKEVEEKNTKPQLKAPKKNEFESKIPIKIKGKNTNYNSPPSVKREKAKIEEKPIKKELPKQNKNIHIQKKLKNTELPIKPKKSTNQKVEHIKGKPKKIKDEEEDEEEEEEEEEEETDGEEENDFDIYKKYQKETLLSKYLKNQELNSKNEDKNVNVESNPEKVQKNNNKQKDDLNESQLNYHQSLRKLPDLDAENQIQCLDEILEEVQNWSSDFLSLNFNVYLEITEKLRNCIRLKKLSSDAALFKAAAIITKIAPLSDKELLKTSLPILNRMSNYNDKSDLFVECHLADPLLKICFNDKEIDEMSKYAAKILHNTIGNKQIMYEMLQLDAMTMLCKEISLHARRAKFSAEYSCYLDDVLGILFVLSEKTSDFSRYSKYTLPINLLTILKIYKNDNSIQNKISEIFKIILDFDENVEQLECEDLSPLFALLESSNQLTVENAIYAISNAISISEFFVDTIAELEPPLGIVGLCNKLQKGFTPINTEILKCLIKLTSFQQGAMMAMQSFNKISMFMDFDPFEMMNKQNGQTDVMYAMKILKNLAYIVPDRVSAAVNGKLKFFCEIGAISPVVDLAKIIIKTSAGRRALEEVQEVPQIASLF